MNFGSITEHSGPIVNLADVAAKIAKQFAMDISSQSKNDIPTGFHSSRTSQCSKEIILRLSPAQRMMVVISHNSHRTTRIKHGTKSWARPH
jgi:hypothetical protein